jgi:hypothetical protein
MGRLPCLHFVPSFLLNALRSHCQAALGTLSKLPLFWRCQHQRAPTDGYTCAAVVCPCIYCLTCPLRPFSASLVHLRVQFQLRALAGGKKDAGPNAAQQATREAQEAKIKNALVPSSTLCGGVLLACFPTCQTHLLTYVSLFLTCDLILSAYDFVGMCQSPGRYTRAMQLYFAKDRSAVSGFSCIRDGAGAT